MKTKELVLEHIFGPICIHSNTFEEALDAARKLKGLPKGVAKYFFEEYALSGVLSLEKAFRILFTNLREPRQKNYHGNL